MKSKEIKDQVIVITGASNPVGRLTARMAASLGARVVAVSRNEIALQELADEIGRQGGDAMYVVADVGKEDDTTRITRSVIRTYGSFDTWINTAGITIFGDCLDVPLSDMRRLFDTNFWGVVNGTRAAIQHFRQTGREGQVITVGSIPSENPEALQALADLATDAVSAWVRSLRTEVDGRKIPVVISLVHAHQASTGRDGLRLGRRRNTRRESIRPSPEQTTEAILGCISAPEDEVYIDSRARVVTAFQGMVTGNERQPRPSPENDLAVDGRSTRKIAARLDAIKPGQALEKPSRLTPGTSGRTLFSSIMLAGLGAGMWLLSRSRNQSITQNKDNG